MVRYRFSSEGSHAHRQQRDRSVRALESSGGVLIEAAIFLPVLLFLLMGIFELGRGLQEYLTLTRVSYEGLRYATTLYGLEPGSFDSTGPLNPSPKVLPAFHKELHDRIYLLLGRNGMLGQEPAVVTGYNSGGAAVSVEVTIRHRAILPFLRTLRIHGRGQGPFLFTSGS